MAMVEAPGGSTINRRGPEQSRPPYNTPKGRGPPRKSREASGIGKKQVPTDGKAPSHYHSFLGASRGDYGAAAARFFVFVEEYVVVSRFRANDGLSIVSRIGVVSSDSLGSHTFMM
eukprot:scaffold95101_cov46-Cyclotella_meneghiniana.AAC.1